METKLDARGLACPLPVVKTKKLLAEYDKVETIVDNFVATQNLEKLAKQLGYYINVNKNSDEEYVVIIAKEKENNVVIDTLSDSCVVPVTQARRVLETENTVEVLVKDENNVKNLENFATKNNHNIDIKQNDTHYVVTLERKEINSNDNEKKSFNIEDDSYIVVINKKIMGHGSEELGSRLIKAYLYALTEQEVLPKKIIFYNDGSILVDKNRSHVLAELVELENQGVEIVCCGACVDYHNIELAVGNPTNMYFIVEDMRKANRIIRP
ncbi:sulfurtransferase-like selenium metabolism protein YedF [Gemella sp. GH3]|uniref:sulfurtransferase-like selenium metabolism protein YedF n=1 Tax=unclassified Gemella TaxID=2624949 RepID=UPI0015CF8A8A|nr:MULTISPECIES: sulfurtransferase-like selenium metabolism protein YedF [unclassified Gemella]MBF0713345.1 sulfurtransferase-like selenium metabolism protein YedF [Gemella sp. GH3.1]NYS50297.1 sulfurtransferase-like selenium metabolism protein YedF [Gemella sp. GH3]